nr:xylulose kinase-1 [Tanacetum cinerariifolium]
MVEIYGPLLLRLHQVVLGNHIQKVYTGYPRTVVDLIHLLTDDNVADLLTKAFDGPRYVVPTGRVIVPTGRYVVSTGRVIVPTSRTGRDHDGSVIILPPMTAEEHIAVQHVADFHYMDDARDIWNVVKARFAKTDSMKVVPLPLFGDYTSLSDHIDLNESQMSYGTKSSTFCDSKSMSNDFVSCDDSDNSLELDDSTSCVSTSSVSTSVNEAEIESNVGTPIKESIIVQDLPSFTCNSSDKNEHTSRTSCNKNGYFNKKAVPTGKPKITPVPTSKPKVTPVPTCKPKVTPVPVGKPQVSTPVPTGRPNRSFPVPTDRGYSPSVVLGNHIQKVYTGYPRTIVDLIHLLTDDNVADLLTKAFDGPRYVVPTGRVIVPTGRYVVLTGRVIVPTGRTGRDHDGSIIILPPTTTEEHIVVQRESKQELPCFSPFLMIIGTYCCSKGIKPRTTLLQSIPDDHVADFLYMDDARDIWNAVKARFGGNAESKKMRKSMLKQKFSEFRTGDAGEFALMGVTSEAHNCPFGCINKYNELKK